MNSLIALSFILGIITSSYSQDFSQYEIRNVGDQIDCDPSFDGKLELEYVLFTNEVTGEILSPCYPGNYYKPYQVNRKIWHIDVNNAVAYRLTVNEFIGGFGDDAPSAVLYYSGSAQQDPGAGAIVLVNQDYQLYGNESIPTGDGRLTQKDLNTGVETYLNAGGTFDFEGSQMFFTLFHNLESITGRFKLTYEPDLDLCNTATPYCENGGVCSRAGFKDYRCACPTGWTGDRCEVDIDECAEGTDNCAPTAVCTNTDGGFDCGCGVGFFGDGVICDAIICPALTIPANGDSISCTDDANYGSACTFVCSTGFGVVGVATLNCGGGTTSAVGSWDNVEPTCEPIVCVVPALVANGDVITCTDGGNFGSACTYTCLDGFGIVGSQTLTCGGDGSSTTGTFDLPPPTCEAITCPELTPIANGDTFGCTDGNNHGSACTYTCASGFSLVGAATLTCDGDGLSTTGTYDNAVPVCTAITCPALAAPANGAAPTCTSGSDFGSVCTFVCDPGFGLNGAAALTCGGDGSSTNGVYDAAAPTCEAITCPALAAPANGNAPTCSSGTAFGSVCTFTCADGFGLVGAASLTCDGDGSSPNGAFDLAPPTCEAITCPALAAPANGAAPTCTSGSDFGSVCTFVCNDGFGLNGAAALTCGGDGSSTAGSYDLAAPTCEAVTCPTLAAPANGNAPTCTLGDGFGSVCTFSCVAGFGLVGDAALTCGGGGATPNGAWDLAPPTCEAITCPALAPIDNATPISCTDDNNYGSVCTVTCSTGFGIAGSSTLECTGDGSSPSGSWDNDPPTCSDIDECATGTSNCDASATCDNTVGSFTCTCAAGFDGTGTVGNCANIDECALGTDNCDANAACADTVGSFTCTCNAGFTGDGVTCDDEDECVLGTDNCDANAACANTVGSFTCTCNTGFQGDGVTCTNIDECADPTSCDVNALCVDNVGSFVCICNAGYTGSGLPGDCSDIDECAADPGPCTANADCINNVGSYTCTCKSGYSVLSGDGSSAEPDLLVCQDDDECALGTDNCHDPNGVCTNIPGSFTCACATGFQGDGVTCTDIDECAADPGPCRPFATCANTVGSFTCSCGAGFCGDGLNTCADVDECSDTASNDCHINAICTNIPGTFTCSCATGYAGDGLDDPAASGCVESGLQPGEIAAIVVCSVIALALIILLIVFLARKS